MNCIEEQDGKKGRTNQHWRQEKVGKAKDWQRNLQREDRKRKDLQKETGGKGKETCKGRQAKKR